MTISTPRLSVITVPLTIAALMLGACDPQIGDPEEAVMKGTAPGKADSSVEAVFLQFEFDGELYTTSSYDPTRRIESQMLYSVGHLNGDNSVGRLDKLELSDIAVTPEGSGYRVTYHARLPVAWGERDAVPSSYTLTMPRDVSYAGLQHFTDQYSASCVDWSAHDVTSGSMWYYYRPEAFGCDLADQDVLRFESEVSPSTTSTTGKYPEYDQVWKDGVLYVTAVFGKNEAGETSNSDAGISAYNTMNRQVRQFLAPYGYETEPANVPTYPGAAMPDVTYVAELDAGHRIEITTLLVDGVQVAGPQFDARYEALSRDADLIAYNGHSGLGANIRALANKGDWQTGQYAVVFMNGCDTYAYVDASLADAHAAINPDDPEGSKYLDIVTNAMPSYFHSNARGSMALVRGLADYEAPRTYEQMFAEFDPAQVVLVSGEHDNVFVPGGGGFEPIVWVGAVGRQEEDHFESPSLEAGTYRLTLSHDPAAPGGDADLYVRAGVAPTTSTYDCRPYLNGSNEECVVTLSGPGTIHAMVRGYNSGTNAFRLALDRDDDQPLPWSGLEEEGTVARDEEDRYETPTVAPGRYQFEITGTADADLYVRIGEPPTASLYDCRPYLSGSSETCVVDLPSPAPIHLMVRGYAASSDYELVGRPQ